jgi:hypothetical protein
MLEKKRKKGKEIDKERGGKDYITWNQLLTHTLQNYHTCTRFFFTICTTPITVLD